MSERQNCIALPASTRVQYQHHNGNIIHIKCTQCLSPTEPTRREIISSLKLEKEFGFNANFDGEGIIDGHVILL